MNEKVPGVVTAFISAEEACGIAVVRPTDVTVLVQFGVLRLQLRPNVKSRDLVEVNLVRLLTIVVTASDNRCVCSNCELLI